LNQLIFVHLYHVHPENISMYFAIMLHIVIV